MRDAASYDWITGSMFGAIARLVNRQSLDAGDLSINSIRLCRRNLKRRSQWEGPPFRTGARGRRQATRLRSARSVPRVASGVRKPGVSVSATSVEAEEITTGLEGRCVGALSALSLRDPVAVRLAVRAIGW